MSRGWVPTPHPDMGLGIPQLRSASRPFASYWNAFLLSYANMKCLMCFKILMFANPSFDKTGNPCPLFSTQGAVVNQYY